MKVTNISEGARGVNTVSGPVLIEPGQTLDVELSAAEHKVAKSTGWFDIEGKPKAEAKKAESGSGQGASETGGLVAEHRGGGRYFVMEGDKAIGEAMSKEDAEAFNALSAEEKAAFVNKPADPAGA